MEDSERRHNDLEKKFNVLQEFVTSNIGIAAADLTHVLASPPRTATPPPPPSPNPERETFYTVRRGARPQTKSFLPISTYNSFAVLAEDEEEDQETRIVGDSIVKSQLEEFCSTARKTRKRLCMPGVRLEYIAAVCEEATSDSNNNNNTLVVLHAGTNDVLHTRSEELLNKYKKLIQAFKTKKNNKNIIISGILPRIRATGSFYDKAFSTNNRLKTLCSQEGVDFINMWDDFYGKDELFSGDGLHLNAIGSARFGRLISSKLSLYRQKNEARPTPDDSP